MYDAIQCKQNGLEQNQTIPDERKNKKSFFFTNQREIDHTKIRVFQQIVTKKEQRLKIVVVCSFLFY